MSSDEMQTVGWPNSVSPGIGAFRIDVPPDWSAIEPAGGLIAFLAPPADNFRVNLVVFGERVPADKGLGELAEEALLGAGATEIVAIGVDGAESEDQLPSAARRTDLMLEGRMVRQLAVTTEGPDRSPTGVRSVYALVGSCLTERADADEKILTEMISSFTVTAGCGSSAGPSRLASAPAPSPSHHSAKPTGHIPGSPPSPAAASAYPAHSR